MRQSDQFGLSTLTTPEEAASQATMILAHIFESGDFSKSNAAEFLNGAHL